MHWIELDFNWNILPHTGIAWACILCYALEEWDLQIQVLAITTDNGSDIVSGFAKLQHNPISDGRSYLQFSCGPWHQRCIAHAINLSVKAFMNSIQSEVKSDRNLISCICSFIKRCNLNDSLKVEFGERDATIPIVDVRARWSSTVDLIRQACSVCCLLNAFCNQIPDLRASAISDSHWLTAPNVKMFFPPAASIAKEWSSLLYVTVGIFCLAYKTILRK